MRLSTIPLTLSRFFLPPAVLSTLYLYLYPIFQQCSFPPAKHAEAACYFDDAKRPAVPAQIAPFRLLAIGDPQLEGDTSLPDCNDVVFPSIGELSKSVKEEGTKAIAAAVKDVVVKTVPTLLQDYRKRLDLWGNDLYLAHIYRTVKWWTQPTHAVVLGDLLGSQWVSDAEFQHRAHRFWLKVFKNAESVPRSVTDVSGRVELLGQDEAWQNRLIAVAGNHDIGYAGDIDEHRIDRFEETFGQVNWEIRFRLNESSTSQSFASFAAAPSSLTATPPELRLVILNSMNLDEPAYKAHLRGQSIQFLADQITTPQRPPSPSSAMVLLTHIPLHKPKGVCVDAPFFDYFPSSQGGGVREQNHLSEDTSYSILDGLLSQNAGSAIVLNGHDHEGCDTYHYEPSSSMEHSGSLYESKPYFLSHKERSNATIRGLREITVRSMMGSFGGNVGLLSGWFDPNTRGWKFEYATCMLGVQHIWWGVHIFDLIVLGIGSCGVVMLVLEEIAANYSGRLYGLMKEEERNAP